MLGFPDDTRASIRAVARYARELNPTFANFNVVTPYPGTQFFEQVKSQIRSFDFTRYDSYTPVLEGAHLTPDEIESQLERAFVGYYFRWSYLRQNGALQWPRLGKLLRRFASVAKNDDVPMGRPVNAGRELQLDIAGLARAGDQREVRGERVA
jgi:radical SAM superfamily enzyme YgiQ (UPF0313 family)